MKAIGRPNLESRKSIPPAARCGWPARAWRLAEVSQDRPIFLFLNISALHPPTHIYVRGAAGDSTRTQGAALEYVDRQLPPLFETLKRRGRPGICYLMSDHGTAFGDDGYVGHRIGHPVVWTVPYAECSWEATR
jgi:hypothetical protein